MVGLTTWLAVNSNAFCQSAPALDLSFSIHEVFVLNIFIYISIWGRSIRSSSVLELVDNNGTSKPINNLLMISAKYPGTKVQVLPNLLQPLPSLFVLYFSRIHLNLRKRWLSVLHQFNLIFWWSNSG